MKSVLMCGNEPTLLRVRAEVLRREDFVLTMLLGLEGLQRLTVEAVPALLVFCNSLSFEERSQGNILAKGRFPTTPVITLLRGTESDNGLLGSTLTPADGPAALVHVAHRLTENGSAVTDD
jgi:hypothetical protein